MNSTRAVKINNTAFLLSQVWKRTPVQGCLWRKQGWLVRGPVPVALLKDVN